VIGARPGGRHFTAHRPGRAALATVTSLALAGCDPAPASKPSASVATATATAVAPAPAGSAPASVTGGGSRGASPAASANAPLEVLRLRLTSAIKDKEPVDDLTRAEPGKRVWAHVTARNRGAGKAGVQLVFRVDGDVRTTVDLDVDRSWSYRTWGYVTLRPDDRGELEVEVIGDGEQALAEATLPIAAAPKRR
jgi:hypothetical protein